MLQQIGAWWLKRRVHRVENFIARPDEVQERVFWQLLREAKHTVWGKQYDYASITSIAEYQRRVPIQPYEQFYSYIERVLRGERDVLWPGVTKWFSKSSGTTNAQSKYIPMPPSSIQDCHYKSGKDMLAVYLHNRPNSRLFAGKSLSVGGSHEISQFSGHARYGDLSAVLIQNMPRFYEGYRTPSRKVALMGEWEAKIKAMARETMRENVTMLAGVPTWTVVLIHKILEIAGKQPGQLHEVWPDLELFIHGAVSFTPYRAQFAQLIPHPRMQYMETYNASEGFFALQYEPDKTDLLLMLDYGIFYEFVPLEEVGKPDAKALLLHEVEIGKNYALVISTNGGLWRYLIGDTVRFTQKSPYKILISGRTKHFLNAFGEEVVVESAEAAVAEACAATGASVTDFTATPIYFSEAGQGFSNGAHEWVIECSKPPNDAQQFIQVMDATLQRLNTDYQAKRYKDIAMRIPAVHWAPAGTFYNWMKQRGKLGGQNKVPRLSNDRQYVEELLAYFKQA